MHEKAAGIFALRPFLFLDGEGMSDAVLMEPGRSPRDPLLGPLGLLIVNPGEAEAAAKLSRRWNWQRHFFFNSSLFLAPASAGNRLTFWAGPAVGAPMAVMALEKLIALGAEKIIVFGWCGSLVQELQVGRLLLPSWAWSEEGTSAHYPHGGRPGSSAALRTLLRNHLETFAQVTEGPIWTTDAPYRETRAKVKYFQEQGLVAVDMEFSALCTVAAYRKVELAAVMLVSDELWQDRWQAGFASKAFRKKSLAVLELLFQSGEEGRLS